MTTTAAVTAQLLGNRHSFIQHQQWSYSKTANLIPISPRDFIWSKFPFEGVLINIP